MMMDTQMKVGDMIFNKWVFTASGGIWYTMGLMDDTDPTTEMLFPNIVLGANLPQLTRWGLARMDYLKEYKSLEASMMGLIGLHEHCLEVEAEAEALKKTLIAQFRADPRNKATEKNKAADPMAWVGRMNNIQQRVHEVIYHDLIYV